MALGRPPGQDRGEPTAFTNRKWKGLNLTDSRLSIDDDELAWLENALVLGSGLSSVPIYAGPPGAVITASLVKESFGCALTYAPNLVPHPVIITVFEDGSAWMRDLYLDGALDTQIATPGTFSSSPKKTDITIWRDGPVLFIDEDIGYGSFDGQKLTLIDATKKGDALAVFQQHVWLKTAPRTIEFTAPASFANFVVGDGAGAFTITDDAFEGEVTHLISSVEQLWIFGRTSVDALGNVVTVLGVTTFTVTNAVTALGSRYGGSIRGYFRALLFYTGYSIHSLLGVAPQKASAKIDRLMDHLRPTIASGPRIGIQKIQGSLAVVFLFELDDRLAHVTRSVLLGFIEGRWFLIATPTPDGQRIMDLATVTITDAPEVWGIDSGGRAYRLFARPGDGSGGTTRLSTKLFDFGGPVTGHQMLRMGLDLGSAGPPPSVVPVEVTVVTEKMTQALPSTFVKFFPAHDAPLDRRFALWRGATSISGQRMGLTVQIPAKYRTTIESLHMDIGPTGDWQNVMAAVTRWRFKNQADSVPFHFTNATGPFFWVS